MERGPWTREGFLSRAGHAPDPFQLAAMDVIDDGDSVLVAAPTGSGKTLVAEYAIERCLADRRRSFYTAPMKALSNQKYRDLCARYGSVDVGLLTGDNSINPDAPIVVMTTEVLRNMLYLDSRRLEGLGVVVLDEVHFLQDAYRGPVWEEVIIHLEPSTSLVCLSATVSNAAEVADWLSTVRGPTRAVVEERRPVELLHHFVMGDKTTGQVTMHDLFVHGQPNGALRQRLVREAAGGARRRGGRTGGGRGRRYFPPSRPQLVDLLERERMLPAIVFIFSRAQCEDAVAACRREGVSLTAPEERREIERIVREGAADLSADDLEALDFRSFLEDCANGVACHHAGMVPMFREAVERCFNSGLVKVVFATETLAVGINMPAKAVVIEKLTKFTGEHHSPLKASEFTQLTGRAGRRGLDVIGHALSVWNPFWSFDQMVVLAKSRSFELRSAFRPTSNMAVNLIRSHSRVETHHLLNLSFAQYQADTEIVGVEARLQRARRDLAALTGSEKPESGSEESDTGEPTGSVRGSEVDATVEDAEAAVRSLRPGDVIVVDSHALRGRAAVIATANRRNGVRLTVVTPSRKVLTLVATDFDRIPSRRGLIELPVPHEPARSEFIREAARRLAGARIETKAEPLVRRTNDANRDVPLGSNDRAIHRLRGEIDKLLARQRSRTGAVVARFEDVVDVLGSLGYVDGWTLTPKGDVLAHIFHESDLLVAELVNSSALVGLGAADLAAVLSAISYDRRSLEEVAVRWPSDAVRERFRRVEKMAQRLVDVQQRAGLQTLRMPDPGIAWETHQWAGGKQLSSIVDVHLSAGDFVRSMRQLIDLARQIGEIAPDPGVREACNDLRRRLDRGVVSASVGSAIDDGD